jgi:hypothetical protein
MMIIEGLRDIAEIIPVKNSVSVCRDPKDDNTLILQLKQERLVLFPRTKICLFCTRLRIYPFYPQPIF